jgi:hypothetical protein
MNEFPQTAAMAAFVPLFEASNTSQPKRTQNGTAK